MRVPAVVGDRLDSWKEIAAYLNRGVRTVRRWESDEGLPVHRHVHRTQGSVYAFKSEIEAWRQSAARLPAERLPEAKSIVVLPFTNLSTDPENEYFADGLTDEVTADLSKVRALRVISRTSSMTFKGTTKDLRTIAGDLGVRYVLEGSVRRAEGRLRITAQLIDAATDAHLWADKYEGRVEDIFAFQATLARMIVNALELRLSTDEERGLTQRPIPNLLAYECYLRARHEGWRWRRDAIDRAVQLLKQGLAIVGPNASLYAALGLAHLQYREAGIDLGEGPINKADECAAKLFALDSQSASALQLRGWIHYSRGGIQDAVRDLQAALALDPNNADTLGLLGNCCLISGKVTAGRAYVARLLAVDPLTPLNRCMPGFADILEGRFESVEAPYRQMFEMDRDNPMARLFYIWVLILTKRTDAVGPIVESFPAQERATVPARIALFLALALSGDAERAHGAVTPDIELLAAASDVFARLLAHGYALAGMPDRALHWLDVAIGRGFINYPFLAEHDPLLASLRGHPRFQELLAIARERWVRFEA